MDNQTKIEHNYQKCSLKSEYRSLLTVDELFHWLNIKRKAIYNLVHYRKIPYLKVRTALKIYTFGNRTVVGKWR
jgi:hypothetical protein